MKTDIRDLETFESLQPTPIKEYLRAQGWENVSDVGARGELWRWHESGGKEAEVVLPLEQSFADYGIRIGELVRTIADVEGRGQVAVVRDISTANSDLVRVRLQTSDASPGTVAFDDAVEAVSHAREMMLAAACAAVEPREHYPSRKFGDAKEYVRKLQMGQTEEGSFVLTILSRVPPKLQGSLVGEAVGDKENGPDVPFARLVTVTLMRALGAAHSAARDALSVGNIEPFERAVQTGVSANLCDALVGLAGADSNLPFGVELAWAPNRGRPAETPNSVAFFPDTLPVFEEVSRVFKSKSPREEFELEGAIVRLDREGDEGPGVIRVMGAVDNQTRKVEVELPEHQFDRAIRGFKNHTPVRVRGELHRTGRKYRLQNPRKFELLPE